MGLTGHAPRSVGVGAVQGAEDDGDDYDDTHTNPHTSHHCSTVRANRAKPGSVLRQIHPSRISDSATRCLPAYAPTCAYRPTVQEPRVRNVANGAWIGQASGPASAPVVCGSEQRGSDDEVDYTSTGVAAASPRVLPLASRRPMS